MGLSAQRKPRVKIIPSNSPYAPISCPYDRVPLFDVESRYEFPASNIPTQPSRHPQDDDAVSENSSFSEKTRYWTFKRVLHLLAKLITAGGVLTLCVELPVYLRDTTPVSHAGSDLTNAQSAAFSTTPSSQVSTQPTMLSSLTMTSITALSTEIAEASPQGPLLPEDFRDCGIFTMKCAGAEGACNNACYSINCVDRSRARMQYIGQRYGDRARLQDNEDLHNRGHAGVKVLSHDGGRRAICGQPPFSQKLRDPQVRANNHAFDDQYDTDEWPMASAMQHDYQPGVLRNTLRCMPKSENQRAGGQWGRFVSDSGDNPGKTCPGPLKRGDIVHVAFDLDGVNPDKLQYCLPSPDCRNDGYQFHLSALVPASYLGGRVDQPYDYTKNNVYELTRTVADEDEPEPAGPASIDQCQIYMTFARSYFFAEVFDRDGKAQGNINTRNLPVGMVPRTYQVHGLDYPVAVTVQAIYNGTDVADHDLRFRYGPLRMPNTLRSYEWDLRTEGVARHRTNGRHEYCAESYSHRQGRGYWKCSFPC